jgi:hypothetical protein
MNTVVDNWISHEDIMEEPGNGYRVSDQVAEGHSNSSCKIFSIVNSSMFHWRSLANGFVSDIFGRFQTADSDGTAWSEEDKNEVHERLKREIERVNMKNHPFLSEL